MGTEEQVVERLRSYEAAGVTDLCAMTFPVGADADDGQHAAAGADDVAHGVVRGAGVQDIAAQLKLSPSTVGTHLYNIKQKLGASNQSELTLVALQWGLIEI